MSKATHVIITADKHRKHFSGMLCDIRGPIGPDSELILIGLVYPERSAVAGAYKEELYDLKEWGFLK